MINNNLKINIIATPLGNLKDISQRAIEELMSSDIILCEDTRMTHRLFLSLELKVEAKLVSYHNFNEKSVSPKILEDIKVGKKVSLVSDAGLPCISDPGFEIIKLCKQNNIFINVIGAGSAFLHAIIKANFSNTFTFLGFIPDSSEKRKNFLKKLTPYTYVCYVSPHKLEDTLKDFAKVYGQTVKLYLIKEMTKLYEKDYEGFASEVVDLVLQEPIKGEFTLVFSFIKQKSNKVNKYGKIN
ncbi:16S rRNA (cytidine(1402)-2'-O)-methyltransferase [Metamycoplasma hyosynoviae]|uniref:16S rRNA (cytidine(1402)-2'-O)-methyltransferase n=1 Tax=Metamycoplasma hyosynoviae TaxID=29559 RepID=UPI002365598A|nr:16S rRNA (cytidine(1402)-2'-O)-methyltransferase [Metamycoplasma hyosynoviae]MDD7884050.1 16S rRNA (cytidine(1402)-2'-O)-methyltransferase [Metamycoplasma hyosynoviae]